MIFYSPPYVQWEYLASSLYASQPHDGVFILIIRTLITITRSIPTASKLYCLKQENNVWIWNYCIYVTLAELRNLHFVLAIVQRASLLCSFASPHSNPLHFLLAVLTEIVPLNINAIYFMQRTGRGGSWDQAQGAICKTACYCHVCWCQCVVQSSIDAL